METKTLWKVFAWIGLVCGLLTYAIGWIALASGKVYWGIPNEFWFYDSIAAWIFALFFLIYSVHSEK